MPLTQSPPCTAASPSQPLCYPRRHLTSSKYSPYVVCTPTRPLRPSPHPAIMLLEFQRAAGIAPVHHRPPHVHHRTRQTILSLLITLAPPQISSSAQPPSRLLRRALAPPPATTRRPHHLPQDLRAPNHPHDTSWPGLRATSPGAARSGKLPCPHGAPALRLGRRCHSLSYPLHHVHIHRARTHTHTSLHSLPLILLRPHGLFHTKPGKPMLEIPKKLPKIH